MDIYKNYIEPVAHIVTSRDEREVLLEKDSIPTLTTRRLCFPPLAEYQTYDGRATYEHEQDDIRNLRRIAEESSKFPGQGKIFRVSGCDSQARLVQRRVEADANKWVPTIMIIVAAEEWQDGSKFMPEFESTFNATRDFLVEREQRCFALEVVVVEPGLSAERAGSFIPTS